MEDWAIMPNCIRKREMNKNVSSGRVRMETLNRGAILSG